MGARRWGGGKNRHSPLLPLENHKKFLHVGGGVSSDEKSFSPCGGGFSSDEKSFSPCGVGGGFFSLLGEVYLLPVGPFFTMWGMSACRNFRKGGASPKTPLKTKKGPHMEKRTPYG